MMEDGDAYGGLSCGVAIDIMSESGGWIETRVECSDEGEWYLPGLYAPGQIPYGLSARLPNKRRFL